MSRRVALVLIGAAVTGMLIGAAVSAEAMSQVAADKTVVDPNTNLTYLFHSAITGPPAASGEVCTGFFAGNIVNRAGVHSIDAGELRARERIYSGGALFQEYTGWFENPVYLAPGHEAKWCFGISAVGYPPAWYQAQAAMGSKGNGVWTSHGWADVTGALYH